METSPDLSRSCFSKISFKRITCTLLYLEPVEPSDFFFTMVKEKLMCGMIRSTTTTTAGVKSLRGGCSVSLQSTTTTNLCKQCVARTQNAEMRDEEEADRGSFSVPGGGASDDLGRICKGYRLVYLATQYHS